MKLSLSAKGFLNIPFEQYEKDFVFLNRINRFLADFISPKVSKIHQIDPTISSFMFEENTDDLVKKEYSQEKKTKGIITKEILKEFIDLGKGKIVEIDENKQKTYEKISIILENKEILEQMEQMEQMEQIDEHSINIKEMNINDSIFQIQKIEKKRNESNIIKKRKEKRAIEYLSSHFYEILKDKEKSEEIKQMKTDTINEIINKETLVIEDENELMEFIIELIEKNKKNTLLLENLIFEMISERAFKNLMAIFDLNEITNEIWDAMKKCFHPKKGHWEENENEKENENENEKEMDILIDRRYLKKDKLIPFINCERIEGILSYLTKKSGGNIHNNGTIEVSSSSCSGGSCLPQNVIDFDNKQNMFKSLNEENS